MLVLGVLSVRMLAKDWLETGFLALLPVSEQDPAIADAVSRHNVQRDKKIIWLIGAGNAESAIFLAKEGKRQLEQSRLFQSILLELPAQDLGGRYRQLFPYRYQLLDGKTKTLIKENPEKFLKENLAILYNPLGQIAAANLERDPLMLFNRYLDSLNPVKLSMRQGIPVLHEGGQYWALMLTELEDSRLRIDKLESLFALSKKIKADTEAKGGGLMATGMPLFTAYGADSAKQEISTVGLGSSATIIVLILLTFRSPRPLLLSSLAIGSGLFAALIVSIMVFGKVHIITLVFGASLIGVADDYALHFICDSFGEKNWRPSQGLRYLFPGLAMGLLINLLSYSGLVLSPFPGLREVALFSAAGLLVAWLTVVLLFPLLLEGFQANHQPVIKQITDTWHQRWPAWINKNRRIIYVILAVFILGGIGQLNPRDDVRLLQSAEEELLRAADRIKKIAPISQENQFFVVSGEDIQTWHRNEQALLARLKPLITQNRLDQYQALSDHWPDMEEQQVNYALLEKALYRSGLVANYMTELGFSKKAIKDELVEFGSAQGKSISLSGWLDTVDESKRQLWLGCGNRQCRSIVSLTGIQDLSALAKLDGLPGVSWVDQVGKMSSLFARYRIRIGWLIAAAYLVVLGGLGLKVGWRDGLSILSIPVVASLFALAMIGWFNQLFSLFNLFALLLVLGIGVDDAIFFYMAAKARQIDPSAEEKRASTSLAVVLSAVTTLLAFGLLALSSTEIVHAFGFTVASGITAALLLSPSIGYEA